MSAEAGWEELRREIERLPEPTLGLKGGVNRAAVLAIVDRLAAARGEPPEPGPARRCPHCKLTATRIGDIHIDAQEIIERTQP